VGDAAGRVQVKEMVKVAPSPPFPAGVGLLLNGRDLPLSKRLSLLGTAVAHSAVPRLTAPGRQVDRPKVEGRTIF
jgi:hypothetical protein